MIRTAFLLTIVLALTACQPDREVAENETDSVPMNLRIEVYSTGDTPATEVERHLRNLIPSGRFHVLPDERIAVAAPAIVQPSIRNLIDQLSQSEPAPPRQIRIRQWLIEATPADSVTIPGDLSYLEGALRDTAKVIGSMAFERLEQVEFRVLEGEEARASGKMLDVSASVGQIIAETILFNLEIYSQAMGSGLETGMSIESGERVVMGMVEHPDRESMLLLVLEAEIL